MTLISLNPNPQSAVLLYLLQDEATAYHFNTQTEPADHLRFVRDVAAKCHQTLNEDADGRDIFRVFRDEQAFFLRGTDEPLCSRRLKLDRLLALAQEHAPCTVAFPLTSQEYRQAQRLHALFSTLRGVRVMFPLIEHHYTPDDCRKIVVEQWGMTPPAMTAWLGEAVCLPCVRGRLAYYGTLWQRSPEAVLRLAEVEHELGQTLFDEGSLEDLFPGGLYAANTRAAHESLLWTPCLCK